MKNPALLPVNPNALETDLACDECGYNMRTLNCFGLCPECASPVVETLSHQLRFPRRMFAPTAQCLFIIAGTFLITAAVVLGLMAAVACEVDSAAPLVVLVLVTEHTIRMTAVGRLTDFIFIITVSRHDPKKLRRAAVGQCACLGALILMLLIEFCGVEFNGYLFGVVIAIAALYVGARGAEAYYLGELAHDLRAAIDQPGLMARQRARLICLMSLVTALALAFLAAAALPAAAGPALMGTNMSLLGIAGSILAIWTAGILASTAMMVSNAGAAARNVKAMPAASQLAKGADEPEVEIVCKEDALSRVREFLKKHRSNERGVSDKGRQP